MSIQKFVQSFFDSVLNWSPCKGTHTAAKLPTNVEDKCEEAVFWPVYVIKWNDVLPKMCKSHILSTTLQFILINSLSSDLIKLAHMFSQAVAQHSLNVDHDRWSSLLRMKSVLIHCLWQVYQRGHSYHFNRFDLGQLCSPFHQQMHKAWPQPMNMGLTLHLQRVTKKEVISVCWKHWKRYVSITIMYNVVWTTSYSGLKYFQALLLSGYQSQSWSGW